MTAPPARSLPDLEHPRERLRWARRAAGYKSASQFAAALGILPETYRTHENGLRKIGPVHAQRYAAHLGVSHSWLLFGDPPSDHDIARPGGAPDPSTRPAERLPSSPAHLLPLRTSIPSGTDTKIHFGPTIGYVPRPHFVGPSTAAYALTVADTAMTPRYRPGTVVFIDPKKTPRPGSGVVVLLSDGSMLLAEYVSGPTSHGTGMPTLALRQLDPPAEIQIASDTLASVHVIAGVDEAAP